MDADDTPDQVGIFEFQFQSHCRFVSVAHVGQQLVERVDGAEAGRRMMFFNFTSFRSRLNICCSRGQPAGWGC